MALQLSEAEVRVLGALVEKETTTPDYYPLSLNALVNACNQKSNRDPVMTLDEDAVRQALRSLTEQALARSAGGYRRGHGELPGRDLLCDQTTEPDRHVLSPHGPQGLLHETGRQDGAPVHGAPVDGAPVERPGHRPRPVLELPHLLQVREAALAALTAAHMELEGDTLSEPDVSVEQHGKRVASFLTVHETKSP